MSPNKSCNFDTFLGFKIVTIIGLTLQQLLV